MVRNTLVVLSLTAVAVGSTACASKKYVRTAVGQVNDKADSLTRSVEQTQERTRQNEARIAEVDQKTQQAGQAAAGAQASADRASTAASAAANTATAASTRAEEIDKASKRLVYEVVLSENEGNFRSASRELPDEAKATLDELISRLKADPKGAFFEIEGHTDNTGNAESNERLGLQRADAVKRYLYEKYQIPLHKMNTVSYGQAKPIGDNKTREGRAQNRRVVIRVIA